LRAGNTPLGGGADNRAAALVPPAAHPLGDPRRHPRSLPQPRLRHHLLAAPNQPRTLLGPLSRRPLGGDMEQLVSGLLPPRGSFGALLRGRRRRALLSQEQLAARAELSERTVRDLETGRVRSPRLDTVRLLADALQLTGPERESWYEAAGGMKHRGAGPTAPEAGSPARAPSDAPAQLPPGSCGYSTGNNHGGRRPPAGEFPAGTVALRQRGDRPAGQPA